MSARADMEHVIREAVNEAWWGKYPERDSKESGVLRDAIMRRVEAAEKLAARSAGVDARELANHLFPGVLSETTARAIERAESPVQALALMLVAPEFLRR